MCHYSIIFVVGVLAGILLSSIVAAATSKAANRAVVLPDEKAAIVRVMIDGREVARFDHDGLFVDGRVTTTGGFLPPAVTGQPAPEVGAEGGAP